MTAEAQPGEGGRLRAQLREAACGLGAKVFGIADLVGLKRDVPDLLARVPVDVERAVVMGVRLQDAVVEGIRDRPTPLYFHNYRQVNYRLDRLALDVADRLQDAGWLALAVPASQIVARDPMRGHVSHRLLARAAGLGWLGRSSLLVHPVYGARVRYVSVLTDAPLPAGSPLQDDCGSCRACAGVCPAGAIHETWSDFDVDACYRKLDEFVRLRFIGQHVCGICVRACPGRRDRDAAADGGAE